MTSFSANCLPLLHRKQPKYMKYLHWNFTGNSKALWGFRSVLVTIRNTNRHSYSPVYTDNTHTYTYTHTVWAGQHCSQLFKRKIRGSWSQTCKEEGILYVRRNWYFWGSSGHLVSSWKITPLLNTVQCTVVYHPSAWSIGGGSCFCPSLIEKRSLAKKWRAQEEEEEAEE